MGHHLGEQGVVVEVGRHHRLIQGTLKLSLNLYRAQCPMNILFPRSGQSAVWIEETDNER
jgi:hypothetical protein